MFQVTVPFGTFAENAGPFVVGLLKFSVKYVFSQRRVDINDIVSEMESRIRDEERKRLLS